MESKELLPRSDSAEARAAIELVEEERSFPTSPSACARIGFEAACRLLRATVSAPVPQVLAVVVVPRLTDDEIEKCRYKYHARCIDGEALQRACLAATSKATGLNLKLGEAE